MPPADDELLLEPPDTIRYGAGRYRAPLAYRACRCLIAAGGGVPLAEFKLRVWGREVCDQTVRSLACRTNAALKVLGCARRLVVRGSSVDFGGTGERRALEVVGGLDDVA